MENLGPGVRIAERWFDRRRIDDDITKKIGHRRSNVGAWG
jgi:hypothetical protein